MFVSCTPEAAEKPPIPFRSEHQAVKTFPSFSAPKTARKAPTGTFTLVKVIDGDTFWAENENGAKVKVRLIGIDAPETRNSARKKKGYYGPEAKICLAKMIGGRRLFLETDIQQLDRYGRLLAYVFVEGRLFVNQKLVEKGCAVVATYPPNVKYAERFYQAQLSARSQKRGLWAR